MMHCNKEPGLACVELSQWEGKQLFVFLRDRIDQADRRFDRPAMESLLNRLDEANSLAVWLREMVVLHLSASEAVLALQVVEANLDGMALPPSATEALNGLRGKLRPRDQSLAVAAG
jgi:hypothetical protein